MQSFTHCFQQNIPPSNEVQKAVNDVAKTFEKTKTEKVCIWFSTFLSTFLLPLTVMTTDISFDIILVVSYVCYLWVINDAMTSPEAIKACHINETVEFGESWMRQESLYIIPHNLNGKPRFFYSTAFIVLPWCFYFFEFLLSRHRMHLSKKVNF